jgi:hypothetical protein
MKFFRPEPLPNLPVSRQVEILLPDCVTQAGKMKIRTKSYPDSYRDEKLLPEPKPNSEPMLMGIASAPILQNPLLSAALLLVCPVTLIFEAV